MIIITIATITITIIITKRKPTKKTDYGKDNNINSTNIKDDNKSNSADVENSGPTVQLE